jgi:hypothetical protein
LTIQQRTSGIIYFDPLDATSTGWVPETKVFSPTAMATPATTFGPQNSGLGNPCLGITGDPYGSPSGSLGFTFWYQKVLNLGSGAGRRCRISFKASISQSTVDEGTEGVAGAGADYIAVYCINSADVVFAISGFSISFVAPNAVQGQSTAWITTTGTIPTNLTGNQTVLLDRADMQVSSTGVGWVFNIACFVSNLLIYSSDILTVTGLATGQEVTLYNATTQAIIGYAVCAPGATSVGISLANETTIPEQIYAVITAADGETIIETTPAYLMCGGDVWNWTPLQTLGIVVDNFQIYQKNAPSGAQPTIAVITATLNQLTPGNPPYAGKTINFSTSLGTLSVATAVTGANGQAVVSLTSTRPGLAVVQATWTGDATVGAASGFVNVHVFYDVEDPDETAPFQLYVQGYLYPYVGGTAGTSHYGVNYQQKIETFAIDIKQYYPTLTPRGIVRIYRYGVLEYAGILTGIKRTIGTTYEITLSGSDASVLLDTRVIQEALYTNQSPEYIINDLLNNYQCGISPGQLGVSNILLPSVLLTDVSLRAAVQQICGLIGWTYRVNPDLSLDFASEFGGGTASVEFDEGDRVGDSTSQLDYSTVANRIILVGSGIVSVQSDSDSINSIGLIEQVQFQKTITDQGTLGAACAAMLADSENTELIAQITVRDNYPPGTFNAQDSITVNIPDLDLAGLYTVVRIQRDLTDPTTATIDLDRRLPELWELDETSARMLNDLSAGLSLPA